MDRISVPMAMHLFCVKWWFFPVDPVKCVAKRFQWCRQCSTIRLTAVGKSRKNRWTKMRPKSVRTLIHIHTVDLTNRWESKIEIGHFIISFFFRSLFAIDTWMNEWMNRWMNDVCAFDCQNIMMYASKLRHWNSYPICTWIAECK